MIHPTAVVDDGAIIGSGTKIWHFCHVCAGAVIGENCSLGQNVFVAGGVRIGHGVRIQNNVSLYDGVTVEDEVFLGPSCVFTNVSTPRSFVSRKDAFEKTIVGTGATVGANATIVCGHDIGAYAFIAAGALVSREVKPHALVMGVPARQVGYMCTCGERLPASLSCKRCGFRLQDKLKTKS